MDVLEEYYMIQKHGKAVFHEYTGFRAHILMVIILEKRQFVSHV